MGTPISSLDELLRGMEPTLNDGVYAFVSIPLQGRTEGLDPIATFRETEGLTLIVAEQQARRAGLDVLIRAAWITLTVHSDLMAIGLTAAVSSALTRAGISCNVVAAAFHDHLFVPVESGTLALEVLRQLQREAAGGGIED